MYKVHLCDAQDLNVILDAINEKALRVVSCFYISDSRQVCIMTEQDDRQPVTKIIQWRRTKASKKKLWQKK